MFLNNPPDTLIINKPAYETILEHISSQNQVKFDKVIQVQNGETAIRMAEEGIGIGILSEYTLETFGAGGAQIPCYT